MKFLLLNQTFHPDVVATAQYLTDVARALVQHGHQVAVITGRRAYDNPAAIFPARESWNGIEIHRVGGTRFGKKSKLRRAADFASFMVACCWQLLRMRRPDVVVALTSPPLISFVAVCYARLRGCRFAILLEPDRDGFARPLVLVVQVHDHRRQQQVLLAPLDGTPPHRSLETIEE